MTKVCVDPGICGLKTTLEIEKLSAKRVKVGIQSQCDAMVKMGEALGELDTYHEVFSEFGKSSTFEMAQKHCKHAACPVPTAILKGIEVECGLALAADVHMEIITKQ